MFHHAIRKLDHKIRRPVNAKFRNYSELRSNCIYPNYCNAGRIHAVILSISCLFFSVRVAVYVYANILYACHSV